MLPSHTSLVKSMTATEAEQLPGYQALDSHLLQSMTLRAASSNLPLTQNVGLYWSAMRRAHVSALAGQPSLCSSVSSIAVFNKEELVSFD